MYHVKPLDPNLPSPARWAVYRASAAGPTAIALTFTEQDAERIARLLADDDDDSAELARDSDAARFNQDVMGLHE